MIDDLNAKGVRLHIIMPMHDAFVAPREIADDDKRLAATLDRYVDLLKRYPDQILELAYQEVVAAHRSWFWPVPAAFIERAERHDQIRRQNEAARAFRGEI